RRQPFGQTLAAVFAGLERKVLAFTGESRRDHLLGILRMIELLVQIEVQIILVNARARLVGKLGKERRQAEIIAALELFPWVIVAARALDADPHERRGHGARAVEGIRQIWII